MEIDRLKCRPLEVIDFNDRNDQNTQYRQTANINQLKEDIEEKNKEISKLTVELQNAFQNIEKLENELK